MSDDPNDYDALESLDQSIFAKLHEDMGEDIQLVLDTFLESIDELLAELNSRSGSESSEAISRCAHSIKSSAASVGMMKLSAMAARLEKAQKLGESFDVDSMVEKINREYQQSRKLL